ncbi:hypothetical protein AX16_010086 [Volvariella volvacea WC 439]|nr:hypothetical protein AX16_010086 [Volvariella volvacea WC 439]
MGISRSVSVVAAYLMKSRGMSPAEALGYVKHRRPQIHPNYGFLKQLQVFVQCSYEPSKFNQVYGSWKRRQKQDVTKYLGYFEDISCLAGGGVGMGVGGGGCQNGGGSSDDDGRGRILLCSNLPKDQDQTDSILSTLGITHLLSLSPAGIVSTILSSDKHKPPSSSPSCFAVVAPRKVKHHHIDLGSGRDDHIPPDVYAGVLKESVGWIQRALASTSASNGIDKKPLVLVHSTVESRVCEVVGAWLIESTGISTKEAVSTMEEALPLFEPTKSLVRNLGAFEKYIATITRATTTNSALSPPPAYIVNLRSLTPILDASVGGLVKEFGSMSVTRQMGSPRVNR